MATARRATPGAAKKTTAKKPAKKTAAKKAPAKKAPSKPPVTVTPPGFDEPGTSLVMVRVGAHDYPLNTSRSCHTCQSPHRRFIENEIVLGRSYNAIARRLADLPTGEFDHPPAQGMARHVREGHLPTPATVRREIIDIEAKRMGAALDGNESLVTHRVVNQTIIQRGFERLQAGEIDVSTSDLLQAIGAQQRIEATSTEGYEVEAMQDALLVYLELAQRFIPPEQMPQYGAAISKHPIIRALAAKQAGQGETEPQTQSA